MQVFMTTALVLAAGLACAGDSAQPAPEACALIGSATIAGDATDRSGLSGEVHPGVPHERLGSMGSGLDCMDTFPGGAHLLAVNDRGPADGAAPFHCRFQRMTLRVDPANAKPVQITHDATDTLKRPDGKPFIGLGSELGTCTLANGEVVSNRLDPEAIRQLPSGNVLVSEEYMPGVLEFDPRGAFVRTWPIPPMFRCQRPGADEAAEMPPANTSGRQPNRGLEGMAITPKGVVWTIPQSPLLQDGALNAKGKRAGRNVRMLCLGSAPGATAMRQVVYPLESPAYGLNELLALDEQRFLVIERDGSAAKFRRIYAIDASNATDVSGVASLPSNDLPEGVRPVSKRLLVDLADPASGVTRTPEKIEGLCFGPTLPDGRRTLVVASDNDMQGDESTCLWVFALPAWTQPTP